MALQKEEKRLSVDSPRVKQIQDIQMLNSFINDTFDIIQCVDVKGEFQLTNPSWHNVLGYSEEDLKSLSLFNIIHPESMDHCLNVFKDVLTNKRVPDFQAKFISKDGRVVEVEGTATPYVVGGEVVSTFTILRDVTQRNEVQNELIQKNERLNKIAWLQSHELRGPLATLMGLLELLEIDKGADVADIISRVKTSAKELDSVTQKIISNSGLD